MKKDDSYIDNLGNVLRSTSGALSIPSYQRKFCWDSSKLTNFYMSLFESFQNDNESETFLGSFILQQDKDSKYENIVDGQQRFTSIYLLLLMIRYHDKKTSSLLDNILFIPQLGKDVYSPAIRFDNSKANKVLLSFLDEFINEVIFGSSSRNKAFENLRNKDKDLFDSINSIEKKVLRSIDDKVSIKEFVRHIFSNAKLNIIKEKDHKKALGIFEVLNTQGEPLTAFEILIPRIEYLLENFELDKKHKRKWEELKDKYSDNDTKKRSPISNAIIISYLMLFHGKSSLGPIKQKEVLYSILHEIDNSKKLNNTLRDLFIVTDFYFDIWERKDFDKIDNLRRDPYLVSCLEFLISLKHTIVLPVLCYFYHDKKTEFKGALKAVAAFSALWRGFALGKTNSIDSKYREIIEGKDYHSLKSLRKKMRDLMNDRGYDKREFVDTFYYEPIRANIFLRFLIISATNEKRFKSGKWSTLEQKYKKQVLYRITLSEATLEHIAPQTPKVSSGYDKKIIDENATDFLGNLTILPSKINSHIGNEKFSKKLQLYRGLAKDTVMSDSYFKGRTTNQVKDQINSAKHLYLSDLALISSSTWKLSHIEKRTKHLAESAFETWKKNLI
jgi:uncharacterized protein with ParB-like and HNH nuclease domain